MSNWQSLPHTISLQRKWTQLVTRPNFALASCKFTELTDPLFFFFLHFHSSTCATDKLTFRRADSGGLSQVRRQISRHHQVHLLDHHYFVHASVLDLNCKIGKMHAINRAQLFTSRWRSNDAVCRLHFASSSVRRARNISMYDLLGTRPSVFR